METIIFSKIPLWLKNSDFYKGFDDDTSDFEIQVPYFKSTLTVNNFEDAKLLILTSDFWGVKYKVFISHLYDFIDITPENYYLLLIFLSKLNTHFSQDLIYKLKNHKEGPLLKIKINIDENLTLQILHRQLNSTFICENVRLENTHGFYSISKYLLGKIKIDKYIEYKKSYLMKKQKIKNEFIAEHKLELKILDSILLEPGNVLCFSIFKFNNTNIVVEIDEDLIIFKSKSIGWEVEEDPIKLIVKIKINNSHEKYKLGKIFEKFAI